MQHIIDMGARPIDRPDIPDHYRVPIFEIPGNEQDASIRVRIYSDGFHLGENKFSTADLRGVEAITEVFGHALDFLRQRRATVARLAPPTR